MVSHFCGSAQLVWAASLCSGPAGKKAVGGPVSVWLKCAPM